MFKFPRKTALFIITSPRDTRENNTRSNGITYPLKKIWLTPVRGEYLRRSCRTALGCVDPNFFEHLISHFTRTMKWYRSLSFRSSSQPKKTPASYTSRIFSIELMQLRSLNTINKEARLQFICLMLDIEACSFHLVESCSSKKWPWRCQLSSRAYPTEIGGSEALFMSSFNTFQLCPLQKTKHNFFTTYDGWSSVRAACLSEFAL